MSGRIVVGRHIGTIGTTVRVLLGLAFLVFGALGHSTVTTSRRMIGIDFAHLDLNGAALAVGLIALPAVTIGSSGCARAASSLALTKPAQWRR